MRTAKTLPLPLAAGAFVLASVQPGGPAWAGQASVLDATAVANSNGSYTISATIAHADTGWKHYADKFEVLAPDGTVLGTRVLYHPHVDEQPFTRSLGNLQVPVGVTTVIVRAADNVHKAGKRTFTLKLAPRK
ncbi:MAG: hypothetical protein V3U48_03500 [Rhodospirillales bacterium]